MKVVYNNEEKEINKGTSILEAFKEEIRNSEYPVIGAMFDNEYQRLDYKLEEEGDDINYIKDYISKAFGYVNYFH